MVDTVVIESKESGPTLEEEAAALEAAAKEGEKEPLLEGESPPEERPEWLPEKFKTPEDLAKAYEELQKKLGAGKGTEDPEDVATQEAATEAVESAGLDMDALSAEYAEKGELTPESLEKLGKVGITPEMVQSYIAGQEAQAAALQAELLAPVGSLENYTAMTEWAATALSDAEIDSFNEALDSGNAGVIKMAVENLKSKYTAANGSEPSVTLQGRPSSGAVGVYESTADLMKDMGNPEYKNNPAFRAKVEAKLARSNIL